MDELALQRMMRESEELERREQRALELAAHRKLYREANGLDAATYEELALWVGTELTDGPVDPYDVLDREEMVQVWEDVEGLARLPLNAKGEMS